MRKYKWSTAVVSALVLIAACSSSGGGSSGDTSSGGSGGSGGTLALKVGTASLSESSQEVYVALDEGIFRKHGLDASLVQINSSSQLAAALLSGTADIANGSGVAISTADIKGKNLVMIGMDEVSDNSDVWGRTDITSVKDLKGKTVSATSPGSNGDLEMGLLLQSNGLQPSDVKHKYLGSEAAEVAALKAGAIDAATLSAAAGSLLSDNPSVHVITTMSGRPFPYHVWAVTADYLKSHHEQVMRFVAAENEALAYVHDPANAEKVNAAIAHYEKVAASAKVDSNRKQNLEVKVKKLQLPDSLVQLSFQLASQAGAGSVPDDVSKYADPSFVNAN